MQNLMVPEQKGSFKNDWPFAIFIAAGVLCLYLVIASRSTLWDRDEPRYARATVEMIESGNYLVPTLNGHIWFDKPILIYWLMSVPVRLLGAGEISCRFFAAAGTAITCLLTFFIGKRLFDAKVGLWAEIILATTLLMLVVGSAALVDGILLPLIVGAMAVFIGWDRNKIRILDVAAVGALMGLGMLAKGPAGVLPVPVMLIVLWFGRRSIGDFIRGFSGIAFSTVLATAIFLLWAIPANNATGGEFVRIFIGRHVLSWTVHPLHSHGGNFFLYLPYYLPVIIMGFFPWILFLPGAISVVAGGRAGIEKSRTLLIVWAASMFILVTVITTKLPHYLLFIWPGLALSVAATIVAEQKNTLTSRDRKWLRSGVWFFGTAAVLIAAGLIAGPWFMQVKSLRLYGAVSGIMLLAMAAVAIRFQLAEKFTHSAKTLLAGLLIFLIPILFGVLPGLEQIKITPFISQAINTNTAADVPVATYKFSEPSLNFYIGRKIEKLSDKESVISWANRQQAGVLIIPADILADIQQGSGPLPLYEIASKKGYNYSNGKKVEILAMIRGK
jgi:4-amino-4-deoxy-L-arabinose transferase-like glycosyltransferase